MRSVVDVVMRALAEPPPGCSGDWHHEREGNRVAGRKARVRAERVAAGKVMLAFYEEEADAGERATSLVLDTDQACQLGRELLALADGRRP